MYHRKTSSQDSSASSSSDHATLAAAGGASMASDLRGVSTPPTSPGLSPLGSPRLPREGVPTELEKSIRIDKGSKQLGKLGSRVIAGHCLLWPASAGQGSPAQMECLCSTGIQTPERVLHLCPTVVEQ